MVASAGASVTGAFEKEKGKGFARAADTHDMSSLRTLVRSAQKEELPLAALSALQELRREVSALERHHVSNARQKGASWDEIARALSVSRQAAQQRFGELADRGSA